MVKDIVEEAIEDKLDNNHFPFLGGQRQNSKGAAPTSNRYGNWHKDKKDQTAAKTVPRILVFIAGGTTYSEMRAGYEVSADKKNWEIVMGECFGHYFSHNTIMCSIARWDPSDDSRGVPGHRQGGGRPGRRRGVERSLLLARVNGSDLSVNIPDKIYALLIIYLPVLR